MNLLKFLAANLLTKIEHAESRLLSWGMVDGSFSDEEVVKPADELLDSSESSTEITEGDELIDAMEQRNLLFSFQQSGETR